MSNQLTRLVELVISGLKPPEMSEGRTEEADGPPVKMVWVLKQPNDEDGNPKLQSYSAV